MVQIGACTVPEKRIIIANCPLHKHLGTAFGTYGIKKPLNKSRPASQKMDDLLIPLAKARSSDPARPKPFCISTLLEVVMWQQKSP